MIYVSSDTEKSDITKRAIALLALLPDYKRVCSDKQKFNNLRLSIIKDIDKNNFFVLDNMNYIASAIMEHYDDFIKRIKKEDAFVESENINECIKVMRDSAAELSENSKPLLQKIKNVYGISVSIRDNSVNNANLIAAEAASQYDDVATIICTGANDTVISLDSALAKCGKIQGDIKSLIYSKDSTLNKRLIYYVKYLSETIKSKIDLYNSICSIIKTYDLAIEVYRDVASYKSQVMRDYIFKNKLSSIQSNIESHIIVTGGENQ